MDWKIALAKGDGQSKVKIAWPAKSDDLGKRDWEAGFMKRQESVTK